MILSKRDCFYLSYEFVHQNDYLNKLKKKTEKRSREGIDSPNIWKIYIPLSNIYSYIDEGYFDE